MKILKSIKKQNNHFAKKAESNPKKQNPERMKKIIKNVILESNRENGEKFRIRKGCAIIF